MSIHHMMATDYYGTPSYGYDTFVTISSKRNVAVQVLDSTKWMRAVRHKFVANYVDRAFWFTGIARIRHGKISQANWTFWPASRPGGPFIWQLPSFGGAFRHEIAGGQQHGTIERRPNCYRTGSDDRRSQHR